MTRRGGREASDRKNGIGENEKQPVMARLSHSAEAFQFGDIGNA